MLDSSVTGDFGVGENPDWDNNTHQWVVVKGEVNMNMLVVHGEGHLILTDGAKLTCQAGVNLEKGNTLYIYGQSTDGLGASEGQLIANNTKVSNAAGIGSRDRKANYDAGDLYIHGGNITAKGNKNSAGIGGGNNGNGGTVVIYGGTVNATGGEDGAGIGGGDEGQMYIVRISGGRVFATGGKDAPGIGGRITPYLNSASLTISGNADVQAIASSGDASGIGSCLDSGSRFPITITGGKVRAKGSGTGPGIGSCLNEGGNPYMSNNLKSAAAR